MSTLNYTTIEEQANIEVSNITTTATTATFLYDALALRAIDNKISNYFTDTNSLPDAYQCNISNGCVVFVESLNIPVMANQSKWMGLDGRLLRNDNPIYNEIWTWGINSFGQLGDNTFVSKRSPVSVVGGFTDWCQIIAGSNFTLGLRPPGTIWTWGVNTVGQLGNNSTINRTSPVSIVGGISDWCQVSANSHTIALRSDGTAWGWGQNVFGMIGDGTATLRSSPVSVVGGFTDWCQVSAGPTHTSAIRTNGTIWAWGRNVNGTLGDGTTIDKSSPVSVVGGISDWYQVGAGSTHTAAIRTDGTIWTWGRGRCGALGDGTTIDKSSPVSVVGGFSDWCQVSGGYQKTAAVRTNGTIWTWGHNLCGKLGDNTTIDKSSPVSVVGGFTNWCQVSTSYNNMGAIKTTGEAWTWGCNVNGSLGDNTLTNRSSPVSVVGGFTDWTKISAGYRYHMAGLRFSQL